MKSFQKLYNILKLIKKIKNVYYRVLNNLNADSFCSEA